MVAYKPYISDYFLDDGPEYKVEYHKKPTKSDPEGGYTWYWTRIHNLPDARKRAMYLIAHNHVMEDKQSRLPKGALYVILHKDGGENKKEKVAGAVVKVHGKYYWKGATNGGYHILNKDGTIEAKTVDVPGMPKIKKAIRRI